MDVIKESNTTVIWYNRIGFKVLIYFLISVLMSILIGLLSYKQAAKVITQKYMESTLEGIKMSSEYIGFGFKGIESAAFEVISNEEVAGYYLGMYSNGVNNETVNKTDAIQRFIITKKVVNSFIYNIYLLSEDYGMNSTGSIKQKVLGEENISYINSVYEQFINNEGNSLVNNKKAGIWMSVSTIDKQLEIIPDKYCIRYARALQNSNGCIIIDVSTDEITKLLKKLDYGEDCVATFMTADYKQIVYSKKGSNYSNLKNNQILENKLKGPENDGSGKLLYEGNEYLYFYSKIGNTGAAICVLVPETSLIKQLNGIRQITAILIAISCIITFLIALHIRKLTNPIHRMMRQMSKIENGNFSIELPVESMDEIGILSKRFNEMSYQLETYINKSYLAQIKQNEAEMTALKSQIYPHFLYNTLEVIRMTALNEGDEKVSDMIDALSSQIHYAIGQYNDIVKLTQEVDIIKKYIYLLNSRNEGEISILVNLNGYAELLVPKLILQPIVENSYIHGFKPKDGYGSIMIEVEKVEDTIVVLVMDNGAGMDETTLQSLVDFLDSDEIGIKDEYNWQSIGLKNVNDRLRYLYGEAYGLRITSTLEVGTMVRIILPWNENLVVSNNKSELPDSL